MPVMSLARRFPVLAYFLLTFLLSWSIALLIALPSLIHAEIPSRMTGILMFPAMLLGPSVSGILLTWLIDGRSGLRNLLERLRKWRIAARWYALLVLPPMLVLAVLHLLKSTVSADFSPNLFYWGFLFGIPAGFLEEIGWTGYAYPKMLAKGGPLSSAVPLGIFWSLWHLPVINFLGASAPHGKYWLHFFLAFAFAMTAMRVLICWQYWHTHSVLLAQLIHMSSTGALVVFSPRVTPAGEAFWYTIYGCLLWTLVAFGWLSRKAWESRGRADALGLQ